MADELASIKSPVKILKVECDFCGKVKKKNPY